MKIVFKDGYSLANRPDIECSFSNGEELKALLHQYDQWQYAYTATIYDDSGNVFMNLGLNDYGNFNMMY